MEYSPHPRSTAGETEAETPPRAGGRTVMWLQDLSSQPPPSPATSKLIRVYDTKKYVAGFLESSVMWNPVTSGLCDITKIIPWLRLQEATQRPLSWNFPEPWRHSHHLDFKAHFSHPLLGHPSPPTHDKLLTPSSTGIFLPEHIVGPANIVASHSITDIWCILISCHLLRWQIGCGRRGEGEGWDSSVHEQGGRQHGGPRLALKEDPSFSGETELEHTGFVSTTGCKKPAADKRRDAPGTSRRTLHSRPHGRALEEPCIIRDVVSMFTFLKY